MLTTNAAKIIHFDGDPTVIQLNSFPEINLFGIIKLIKNTTGCTNIQAFQFVRNLPFVFPPQNDGGNKALVFKLDSFAAEYELIG